MSLPIKPLQDHVGPTVHITWHMVSNTVVANVMIQRMVITINKQQGIQEIIYLATCNLL